MPDAAHAFGGAWTELKLSAVSYYLEFYTRALTGKSDRTYTFELWYIDAFAGSGERTEAQERGGIFEGTPVVWESVQLDGSAKRAMSIDPPFKRLLFIEDDPARYAALCALEKVDDRVECIKGDANLVLPEVFARDEWKATASSKGLRRGVVFLDPYGMQVSWETLRLLAETKRVDVWYLFPLEAVTRQLAHDYTAVDQWKQSKLDAVFGGPEWRDELYQESPVIDLFTTGTVDKKRAVSRREIEAYFAAKLSKLFSFVSDPLPLGDGKQQKFSLFLLVANDSPKAIGLARSGVTDLLRKHRLAQASRRTSGL